MLNNCFYAANIIVFISSYHQKNKQENDILNDKLQMLNAILKSTNHEKIYTLEKIKEIELESDEEVLLLLRCDADPGVPHPLNNRRLQTCARYRASRRNDKRSIIGLRCSSVISWGKQR